jgi:hypothetical protein
MNAADVMVSNVITVGPDATVQDVAGILLKNKISAVPVVSQSGKILGIVSEGDMLRRVESHTLRHRSWWLRLLTADTTLRDEFVKYDGHCIWQPVALPPPRHIEHGQADGPVAPDDSGGRRHLPASSHGDPGADAGHSSTAITN